MERISAESFCLSRRTCELNYFMAVDRAALIRSVESTAQEGHCNGEEDQLNQKLEVWPES